MNAVVVARIGGHGVREGARVAPVTVNVCASLKSAFVASCNSYAASSCGSPFHVIGVTRGRGRGRRRRTVTGTRGAALRRDGHRVAVGVAAGVGDAHPVIASDRRCVMVLVRTGRCAPLTGFDGSPDCARNH